MNLVAATVFGIAISALLAVLTGTVRAIISLVHFIKVKRYLFATIASFEIATLVTAFFAMLVVWFGYGVAHTGKSATSDLIVLVATVVPAYMLACGVWYLSGYLDRIVRDAT